MTFAGWAMILLFIALFVALAKPMGAWLYALYGGQNIPGGRMLAPVERGLYRLSGVNPEHEQSWVGYAVALLAFNIAGMVLLFAIQQMFLHSKAAHVRPSPRVIAKDYLFRFQHCRR